MTAIQLNAFQWRDMVLGNLTRIISYVQVSNGLGPKDAIAMRESLAQTGAFISAWEKASAVPDVAEPTDQPPASIPHEGVNPHQNGAEAAPVLKRRRGWPKGKPRKAAAEQQV